MVAINDEEVLKVEADEFDEVSTADKHQKFLELSANRIRKAAKCIDILSNLSNRGAYNYSQEEVEKMFDYLQWILDDAKEKFIEKPDKPPFEW